MISRLRPLPPALRSFLLPLRSFLLPLLPVLAVLSHSGCEGTSSGVDNPGLAELTVSFRDAGGSAVRVTGDLDVYYKDQNPALAPEPAATVRIRNSSLTSLTGEDFRRLSAATKRSAADGAGSGTSGSADSAVAFNVVFRSEVKTGTLAFGMVYDPKASSFSRDGKGLTRLDLQPKPLIRFEARLQRDSVHGDLGRVFIPGTPFQATLTDSGFVFGELPEGVFPLRLLGGDGRIFAVRESLDTKDTRIYTPMRDPIGKIDTADTSTQPRFSLYAGPDRETFLSVSSLLEAKVDSTAIDSADARISTLWRQLLADSPDSAWFTTPTSLRTQVKFRTPGAYSFEVSVTIGFHTERDTVTLLVRDAPPPKAPAILQPKPGDTVYAGVQTKISWEMPVRGTVSIQLMRGGFWQNIADSVAAAAGLSVFTWTPADTLAPMRDAILRVRMGVSDSLTAVMIKPFFIQPNPLGPAKPKADSAK